MSWSSPSWAPLGAIFGRLRRILDRLGALSGRLGALWEGFLGRIAAILGASWAGLDGVKTW